MTGRESDGVGRSSEEWPGEVQHAAEAAPPWEGLTGADLHAACLEAARDGDRRALAKLVDELTPLVWHIARANGLDRQTAEDVVQTVWLALFSRLKELREPRALAAWLIVTARREASRPYGRRARPVPLSDEMAATLVSDHPAPEEEAVRADRDRRVWRAFRLLSARCQELLRLTVLAGRAEYGAVAEALRMPRGSIGPTRGRCLHSLRELLAGEEEDRPPFAATAGIQDPSAGGHPVFRDDAAGAPSCLVYVAGDDHVAARRLAEALTDLLANEGIDAVPDGPPVISSWKQRFTLRTKRALSRSEVKQRLQKVEHAVEVVALQKPMSEVNAQHADAVQKLFAAAAGCDNFVALVGSLLVAKQTDETGRVSSFSQTLSVAQVRALEQNQHLLKSPHDLLANLEALSCDGDDGVKRIEEA